MSRDFWRSAGHHLLERNAHGWLRVTPDWLRAYLTRPEIHPVEDSCAAELTLFNRLMDEPFAAVTPQAVSGIADPDTAENYRAVLTLRDHLARHGTLEAAYAAWAEGHAPPLAPVFLDQMVHAILRGILDDERDPITLRAAEIFFRDQAVTLGEDRLMLADAEIVDRTARTSPNALDAGPSPREAQIDILSEATAEAYWERSDRFDTGLDFRFTQPAQDALGRVMSLWIAHFTGVTSRIEARASIRDAAWSWHIGCDAQSSAILDALWRGEAVTDSQLWQLIALYRLEIDDRAQILPAIRGKPVYLGLAMDAAQRLRFKPQNLLGNLPLMQDRAQPALGG